MNTNLTNNMTQGYAAQAYTGYAAQSYGQQVKAESKGLAVGSMVAGILSIVTFWTGSFALICAIVAMILGAANIVLKKPGKGMAIAGIICGAIALFPAITVIKAKKKIAEGLAILKLFGL